MNVVVCVALRALLLSWDDGDRGGKLGGEGVLDIGLGRGDDGAVLLVASTASDQGFKFKLANIRQTGK